MTLIRKFSLPVLVLVVSIATAGEAMAAKEKFERTKPHVNIGTIGHVDRSVFAVWITVGVFETSSDDGETPCSGVLDLELVDPTDPAAGPLAELNDVRLVPGRALGTELPIRDAGSGPVNYVVVAREMEVDGRSCFFRGAVEVRDIVTGETTKFAPLKPAEFIILKAADEEDPSSIEPSTQ